MKQRNKTQERQQGNGRFSSAEDVVRADGMRDRVRRWGEHLSQFLWPTVVESIVVDGGIQPPIRNSWLDLFLAATETGRCRPTSLCIGIRFVFVDGPLLLRPTIGFLCRLCVVGRTRCQVVIEIAREKAGKA